MIREATPSEAPALAELLGDCVDDGASVGFLAPLDRSRAEAFWAGVLVEAAAGDRVVLVAEAGAALLGTVQVVLRAPENQPHRGEVAKMMVHPAARRAGVGGALLAGAEGVARAAGKSLLVLDTASAEAARLYERRGWQRVGVIPGYALGPYGGLTNTTVYWRSLD